MAEKLISQRGPQVPPDRGLSPILSSITRLLIRDDRAQADIRFLVIGGHGLLIDGVTRPPGVAEFTGDLPTHDRSEVMAAQA